VLDLKGARVLKKIYPQNTVNSFVLPPSLSVLKTRMRVAVERLMRKNSSTFAAGSTGDLGCSRFDYSIMNQNLQVAFKELKKIFLKESSA